MSQKDHTKEQTNLFKLSNLAYLISISRPLYLLVFLVGFGYCLMLAKADLSSPPLWLQTLWLTFPTGIILFGLNDIYDYPSDIKNPRKGGKWGAILEPIWHPTIFKLSIVFSVLFILISLLTANILNIICTLFLLVIAWGYSVPPLRLKIRPPWEFIANIAGAFALSLLAFSWGTGIAGFNQIITGNIVIAEISWALGLALLSYLADFEEDKQAGDLTTVHWLGKRNSLILSTVFYVLAAIFTLTNKISIYPISFIISTLLGIWLMFNTESKNITRVYHWNWYIAIIAVVLSILVG